MGEEEGTGGLSLFPQGFYVYLLCGVMPLELPYCILRKYIILIESLIVGVRIPLPLYQILSALLPSRLPRVQNGLDFIFFFSIDQIRWRALIVVPMEHSFMIGGEKIGVEYWVYAPLLWQLQSISD